MVLLNNIFLLISVVILIKTHEKFLWFKVHKVLNGFIYHYVLSTNHMLGCMDTSSNTLPNTNAVKIMSSKS